MDKALFNQISLNILYGLALILMVATISLTYSVSSRLTEIKLTGWWKLFVTAFLQVVLAIGLYIFREHEIRSAFLYSKFMEYYVIYIFIIAGLLGAVILKLLTARPWLSLLKVWGIATLLQIFAVPFCYVFIAVFFVAIWKLINPGFFE